MGSDPKIESRSLPPDWDEPPPFLGTWKRVYAAVILYTIVIVATLYILTITMNR
jgi:hypothetical protein